MHTYYIVYVEVRGQFTGSGHGIGVIKLFSMCLCMWSHGPQLYYFLSNQ